MRDEGCNGSKTKGRSRKRAGAERLLVVTTELSAFGPSYSEVQFGE